MMFLDQMHRKIELPHFPPQRIISLVPSQTELLHALDLSEQVLGITKFCTDPKEWLQTKKTVGGTKTLNNETIEALQPDLILGNKEENEQTQVLALMERYPVWMSDIVTLEDACAMILGIGAITDRRRQAENLVAEIQQAFATLSVPNPTQRKRAAYFIWRKPFMVAGAGTFIDAMLEKAGFENVFGDQTRYPEISLETLKALQPEVLLLSSEPYPFAPKHLADFQERCPKATILLVDGTYFSWYGSRLRAAPAYFAQLQQSLHNSAK